MLYWHPMRKHKDGLIILLVLLTSALFALSFEWRDESYRVYSAAVHRFQQSYGAPGGMVFVADSTDNRCYPHSGDGRGPNQSAISWRGYQECMAQLRPQKETQADYESANLHSHKLKAKFSLPNYQLLGPEDKAGAGELIFLSAVGFNRDKTQALVTVNFQWASVDYLLEKSPDTQHPWIVVRQSEGRGGMERAD